MEELIVLALIGIVGLVSPRRVRRRVVAPIGLVALITIAITSPVGVAIATQGLTFSLPTDVGERVDAIVTLGRGEAARQSRVDLVERLWQQKRGPQIFVSGMLDAQSVIEQLKQDGIPKRVLSGESCSQNTEENARFTSAILYPRGVRKILLVTDPAHMLRSTLLYRGFGFTVTPHTVPLPPQYHARDQALVLLREYVGLVAYAIQGRFTAHSNPELQRPAADIQNKIAEWNCYLTGV